MTKHLTCVGGTGSLSISSLSNYISWVNRIPLLTQEEETNLAERFQKNGDLEAARKLVLSHLRFVVRIARGYSGYGLSHADLVQEGNIGLMKAVKRFDPSVGVRLVSFAIHWIRAEIHEFILKNWRIVKVATTKAQRKLFFNLRKKEKEKDWLTEREIKNLALELDVRVKDVQQMEERLNSYDESFDLKVTDSDYASSTPSWSAPANYLEDKNGNPATQLETADWQNERRKYLYQAVNSLDDRSKQILSSRWLSEGEKPTLQDLAKQYNISAERVRQLEKNAMLKVRAAIESEAG